MSRKLFSLLVLFSFAVFPPGNVSQAAEGDPPRQLTRKQEKKRLKRLEKELEGPFRRWLKTDVIYIITGDERKAFLRLTTAEELSSNICLKNCRVSHARIGNFRFSARCFSV